MHNTNTSDIPHMSAFSGARPKVSSEYVHRRCQCRRKSTKQCPPLSDCDLHSDALQQQDNNSDGTDISFAYQNGTGATTDERITRWRNAGRVLRKYVTLSGSAKSGGDRSAERQLHSTPWSAPTDYRFDLRNERTRLSPNFQWVSSSVENSDDPIDDNGRRQNSKLFQTAASLQQSPRTRDAIRLEVVHRTANKTGKQDRRHHLETARRRAELYRCDNSVENRMHNYATTAAQDYSLFCSQETGSQTPSNVTMHGTRISTNSRKGQSLSIESSADDDCDWSGFAVDENFMCKNFVSSAGSNAKVSVSNFTPLAARPIDRKSRKSRPNFLPIVQSTADALLPDSSKTGQLNTPREDANEDAGKAQEELRNFFDDVLYDSYHPYDSSPCCNSSENEHNVPPCCDCSKHRNFMRENQDDDDSLCLCYNTDRQSKLHSWWKNRDSHSPKHHNPEHHLVVEDVYTDEDKDDDEEEDDGDTLLRMLCAANSLNLSLLPPPSPPSANIQPETCKLAELSCTKESNSQYHSSPLLRLDGIDYNYDSPGQISVTNMKKDTLHHHRQLSERLVSNAAKNQDTARHNTQGQSSLVQDTSFLTPEASSCDETSRPIHFSTGRTNLAANSVSNNNSCRIRRRTGKGLVRTSEQAASEEKKRSIAKEARRCHLREGDQSTDLCDIGEINVACQPACLNSDVIPIQDNTWCDVNFGKLSMEKKLKPEQKQQNENEMSLVNQDEPSHESKLESHNKSRTNKEDADNNSSASSSTSSSSLLNDSDLVELPDFSLGHSSSSSSLSSTGCSPGSSLFGRRRQRHIVIPPEDLIFADLSTDSSEELETLSSPEADDEFECDCSICALHRSYISDNWLASEQLGPWRSLTGNSTGGSEAGGGGRRGSGEGGNEEDEEGGAAAASSFMFYFNEPNYESLLEDYTDRRLLDSMFQDVISQMLAVYPDLLSQQAPPPLTVQQFDALPMKLLQQEDLGNGDFSCSICLCPFVCLDETKVIQCKHVFHTLCLQAWLNKSGTCPVCRDIICRSNVDDQSLLPR